MFYVIDIRVDPPTKVEGTESEFIQDCVDWILLNGDAIIYSIKESN